jgi:hypothetical protein
MSATVIPFPAKHPGFVCHEVTFRRLIIGFDATCTCGWTAAGLDKRRLEAMAGSHDLDDEVVA